MPKPVGVEYATLRPGGNCACAVAPSISAVELSTYLTVKVSAVSPSPFRSNVKAVSLRFPLGAPEDELVNCMLHTICSSGIQTLPVVALALRVWKVNVMSAPPSASATLLLASSNRGTAALPSAACTTGLCVYAAKIKVNMKIKKRKLKPKRQCCLCRFECLLTIVLLPFPSVHLVVS